MQRINLRPERRRLAAVVDPVVGDGEPRFASCVTIEPSRIAVLTRDAMLLVLHDEPRLGSKILLKLVQLLSDRLRQTSAKLVSYLEASREA